MTRKRFISMLVLLMMAATGAWAQEQSETSATTDNNIVEGTHFTISNGGEYADEVGMCAYGGGITVTSKNGETITKVVISCTYGPDCVDDDNTSVSSGTKEITNGGLTITVTGVNASTFTFTCSDDGAQFGQFVVYYTEAPAPAPAGYAVSLKAETADEGNWTAKAGEGDYQALPLEGVAAGTAVSVKYNGTKKVKSVKAKKKAAAEPAGPTAYTLAESTQGMIVGTDGKAYDVADKDNLPTGVTAAGVVVYKNGANGLAIALTDEASTMYWSTANGETGAAAHTPTVTGYSWRLPSMDEWKQMFGANGGNNESYTGLNTAINTAGGTALLVENGIYWTCTETAYSGHYIAFLNANVSFFMDDDNNANRIRACIAF